MLSGAGGHPFDTIESLPCSWIPLNSTLWPLRCRIFKQHGFASVRLDLTILSEMPYLILVNQSQPLLLWFLIMVSTSVRTYFETGHRLPVSSISVLTLEQEVIVMILSKPHHFDPPTYSSHSIAWFGWVLAHDWRNLTGIQLLTMTLVENMDINQVSLHLGKNFLNESCRS